MGRRHTIPKTKPADKPKNKKKGSKKPVKEVHEEVKDNQQQEKEKYIGEYVMEQRNGCVFFLKQGEQVACNKQKEETCQIPCSEPEISFPTKSDEKIDPLDLDKFLWRDHSDFRQLSPAFKYDFLRTKTIAKEIIEGIIKELRNARDVYEISRCVQRCHIRTINTNFWEEKLQYMYNKSVLGDISEDDLVSAYITFSEFTESCYSKELTNSEDVQTASGISFSPFFVLLVFFLHFL